MTPHVSVVMPARNEARFVRRALRSISRQTFRDFEVLVIDDGSTDRTRDIAREHAAADGRFRLLENPSSGFVPALNHGIERARGALIARLDADDVALRLRLEAQVGEFEHNPRLVALGTYGYRINELGLPVGLMDNGPAGREGYRAAQERGDPVHLTHCTATFKRDAALEVGGYDAGYYPSEDYKLWNDLAELGEVYALEERLALYRLRAGGITAARILDMHLQWYRVMAERGEVDAPFDDLEAFRSYLARDPEHFRRLADRCREMARRRSFGRALANARLFDCWRLARGHGGGLGDLAASARRALSGE